MCTLHIDGINSEDQWQISVNRGRSRNPRWQLSPRGCHVMLMSEVSSGAWIEDHIPVDSLIYFTLCSSPPITPFKPGGCVRSLPLRNKPQTEYQHIEVHHKGY